MRGRLRAWAAGHLAKNSQLARSGPYASVRNPLYIGTLLVAAGLVLRTVEDGPPVAVTYRASESGLALMPALTALTTWAENNLRECPPPAAKYGLTSAIVALSPSTLSAAST